MYIYIYTLNTYTIISPSYPHDYPHNSWTTIILGFFHASILTANTPDQGPHFNDKGMTRGRGIARRDEVTIPKPNWWLVPIQISLTLSSKLAITPIFHRFLGTWCVTIFVEVCKTSKNRPKASFSRLFESCRSHPCLIVKSCALWLFNMAMEKHNF